MMEKPILFSTSEVRAILDGRKTQTRQVIKPQPNISKDMNSDKLNWSVFIPAKAPCQPGDILWVRETWQNKDCNECPAPDWPCATNDNCIFGDREYLYAADNFYEQPLAHTNYVTLYEDIKWRPSSNMPRAAARILLWVTDVRVERVMKISINDLSREGFGDIGHPVEIPWYAVAKNSFAELWDSLNAKCGYGWNMNPWFGLLSLRR